MHVILVYVNEQATCGVNRKDGKHEEKDLGQNRGIIVAK
jgi:hypothetical protein